jgi:hypothetical protein
MRLYTTGFRPLGSSTFLEWVDGERLEVVVPGLDRDDSASLGLALGRVLASVHSFDFEKFGFFGPDLRVPAIDLGGDGLFAYLRQCIVDKCVVEYVVLRAAFVSRAQGKRS